MGQKILNWVVISLALAAAGLYGYHKYGPATRIVTTAAGEQLTYYWKWQDFLSKGSRMGPADAPVQVIEIANYECPACLELYPALKQLRAQYPQEVAITFVQQPSEDSPNAEFTARATACAEAQGKFAAMHDLLFEQHRQIGVKSWTRMAIEANLHNIPIFEMCLKSKEPPDRIAEARELAEQIDLKGSPTLIVNGRKLARLPAYAELEKLTQETLAQENERRRSWWKSWLPRVLST